MRKPVSALRMLRRVFHKLGGDTLSRSGNVYPLAAGVPGDRLQMEVHQRTDTEVSRAIRDTGVWEIDETTLLQNVLKPGQTFIDVGANIGYFTLLASSLVGDTGRVVAVEPDPTNFKLLERNVQINRRTNIHALNLALSDQDSEGFLYLNETNLGDHSIFSEESRQQKVPITIRRGDELVLPLAPAADFIKIDTQGSEFHVLRGLRGLLDSSRGRASILLEVTPNSLIRCDSNPHHMIDLLAEWDVEFYVLHKSRLVRCDRQQMETWINITLMDRDSIGFMNLLCCPPGLVPPTGWPDLPLSPLDLLDAMLGSLVPTWNGERRRGAAIGEVVYLKKGWGAVAEWGCPMNARESSITIKPELQDSGPRELVLSLELRDATGAPLQGVRVSVNDIELGTWSLERDSFRIPSEYFKQELTGILLEYPGFDEYAPSPGLCALGWNAVK